jgi:hypothetical protein
VEDRRLPQRRCEGANAGTRSKLTFLPTSTLCSSDNDHLFSSFRGHEKVSESSGMRHCQARRVPAICHSNGTTEGFGPGESIFEETRK